MPNVPVKLYLPEEAIADLEEAASETKGKYTPNAIAVDVIMTCLPIWRIARQAFDGVLEDTLREMSEVARERRAKQKK